MSLLSSLGLEAFKCWEERLAPGSLSANGLVKG